MGFLLGQLLHTLGLHMGGQDLLLGLLPSQSSHGLHLPLGGLDLLMGLLLGQLLDALDLHLGGLGLLLGKLLGLDQRLLLLLGLDLEVVDLDQLGGRHLLLCLLKLQLGLPRLRLLELYLGLPHLRLRLLHRWWDRRWLECWQARFHVGAWSAQGPVFHMLQLLYWCRLRWRL